MSDSKQHSELLAQAHDLLSDGPRGEAWTESWVEEAREVLTGLVEQLETTQRILAEERRWHAETRQALERRIMEATYGATPEERSLFASNPASEPDGECSYCGGKGCEACDARCVAQNQDTKP